MNLLQKIGLCLGSQGTQSAVDKLCKEQDKEVLNMKTKIEEVFEYFLSNNN